MTDCCSMPSRVREFAFAERIVGVLQLAIRFDPGLCVGHIGEIGSCADHGTELTERHSISSVPLNEHPVYSSCHRRDMVPSPIQYIPRKQQVADGRSFAGRLSGH